MRIIQSDEAMAIPKIVKERYDKLCDKYRCRIEKSIKEFGQRGFSLTFDAPASVVSSGMFFRTSRALGDIVEEYKYAGWSVQCSPSGEHGSVTVRFG